MRYLLLLLIFFLELNLSAQDCRLIKDQQDEFEGIQIRQSEFVVVYSEWERIKFSFLKKDNKNYIVCDLYWLESRKPNVCFDSDVYLQLLSEDGNLIEFATADFSKSKCEKLEAANIPSARKIVLTFNIPATDLPKLKGFKMKGFRVYDKQDNDELKYPEIKRRKTVRNINLFFSDYYVCVFEK